MRDSMGPPWNTHQREEDEEMMPGVVARRPGEDEAGEEDEDKEVVPRRVRITKEAARRFGPTAGCPGF